MPVIRCPKCDDPVEIEDDWFGRRIACPACDHQFTPRRSRGSDFDDEEDRRPRRRSSDRDDDRPRRRGRDADDRPVKKGGNAVLWVVLALVGVFVVLPCLGCVGFVLWGMNAKETFTGPWADHSVTATDGQAVVTATYPKPPSVKFASVAGSSGGQVLGYDNAIDGGSPLDVIFAVGYYDFPAGGGDPLTTTSTPSARRWRTRSTWTWCSTPPSTPTPAPDTTAIPRGRRCTPRRTGGT